MTNGAAGAGIEAQHASWYFEDDHGPHEVPVPYAVIGEPEAVLFTGFGETDVAGIAERLSRHGATDLLVASLTYPSGTRPLPPEVFEQAIVEGAAAVTHAATGNGRPIARAYGVSGGGSQLLVATHHRPELADDIVLVAPGPLNPSALNPPEREATPKNQARTLLKRFDEAGLIDIMKEHVSGEWRQLVRELIGGLEYAATVDEAAVLKGAVRRGASFFVGDRDRVTPAAEYAHDEEIADRVTIIPSMGHPTTMADEGSAWVADIIRRTQTPAAQPEALPGVK